MSGLYIAVAKYNGAMSSETRLAIVIFACLILAIVIPFVVWRTAEARRYVLLEVRVVTATEHDPVFRDGLRRLAADEPVRLAVAVRLGRPGEDGYWQAPAPGLVLEGEAVDHVEGADWPEDDRSLRVFWFTLENTYLGGVLTRANCSDKLRYRSFLAPELGNAVVAAGSPEAHNDDQLGASDDMTAVVGGTLRLYARVEVVSRAGDVKAHQAINTLGANDLHNPALATISRAAPFTAPLDGVAGELLLLPGYEPDDEPPGSWDEVTRDATGFTFSELVERRILVSSKAFAATLVAGQPDFDVERLQDLGELRIGAGGLTAGKMRRRWSSDVRPGDILVVQGRWIVAREDDGDGVLDLGDTVFLCWKRPPEILSLGAALGEGATTALHLRYQRPGAAP